jgi:hypothetical protein
VGARIAANVSTREGVADRDVSIVSEAGQAPWVEIFARRHPSWRVSFSRSGGRCIGVLAWGCDVGVDWEKIAPDFSWTDVAQSFFGEEQAQRWRGLPPDEAREAFYRAWVRGEAALKCLGVGFRQSEDFARVHTRDGLRSVEFNVTGGYVACVTTRKQ